MEETDQGWQEEIRLNHDNAAAAAVVVMAEEEEDGMSVESSPTRPTGVPGCMDAAHAGSSSYLAAPHLNRYLAHLGGALPAGVPSTSSLQASRRVQPGPFPLSPQASTSFPQASPTSSSSPQTDSALQDGARSARTSGLRTSPGDEQGIAMPANALGEALSPQLVHVREAPFARGIPFSRVRVTLEAQTLMRKLRLRRLRDGTVRQSRALVRTLKRLERQLAEFQYRMQVLLLQLQRLQSVEQELQEQRQAYLQGNEE